MNPAHQFLSASVIALSCANCVAAFPDKPNTPTLVVSTVPEPERRHDPDEERSSHRVEYAPKPAPEPIELVQRGTEYTFACRGYGNRIGSRTDTVTIFEQWQDPSGVISPAPMLDLDTLTVEAQRRFVLKYPDLRGLAGMPKTDCDFRGMTLIRIEPYWPDIFGNPGP